MGERKVLNKYFPPDFDPKKIPRRRQPKNQQTTVRMMLPMCIRCANCSNYIYKGTKFNSPKEVVIDGTYLGATRNFEPWRVQDKEMDKEKQKRDTEEFGDSMKSLENRRLDSKRRMDIDAGLDELKSLKARQASVGVDAMLEATSQTEEELEDEALIRSVVFGRSRDPIIKSIHDEEFAEEEDNDDLVF